MGEVETMKVKEMTYVGLFVALVAVLGYIPAIPLPFSPVPITAQTLGVMLAGSVLGSRLGGLSMLVLILLAIVGAPVLVGGSGGLSHILGPSGGFALSFPLAAFSIGFLVERFAKALNIWKLLMINIFGGIIIVYLIGIPYMAVVAKFTLSQAFYVSMVYIPGDLIKAIIATLLALQLKKSYPIIIK